MALYTKESLQQLRDRIDLVEVLTAHIDLKRAGAAYKALCPFHEEKSPSFMMQKGDTHYHCFGCGAHGDAIQFLMAHLKLTFSEAVESLAERFHVPLVLADQTEEKGINKAFLKESLEVASQFFHTMLLHTEEGHEALAYLYKRGLSLEFVTRFELGLAPVDWDFFRKVMHAKKISDTILLESGLINEKKLPFFRQRITFPIRNPSGAIIGFSARKYKEETFGGKYINTPETPLFKKSRVLFGMHESRRNIAKERKAIIVEGQIDCLRLIEAGFAITVAALGTAFGEGHIRELVQLGVRQAVLLFDGDTAGETAASKVGHLFQKAGIDVSVVLLPAGSDPDSFLAKYGPEKLAEAMGKGIDFLSFQIKKLSRELKADTPAGKSEMIHQLTEQIKEWEDPVMIHESLRKLASLTHVPEEMLGINSAPQSYFVVKQGRAASGPPLDPNRILELDLLRWLLLMGEEKPALIELVRGHLTAEHFVVPICRNLFEAYMGAFEQGTPRDLLSLLIAVDQDQGQQCISEILNKKINPERAELLLKETVQKILDRDWMQRREEVKMKIHSGSTSEEETLALVKQFDDLKKLRPSVLQK